MPWARLHALKDYYDMPARLAKFEGVHQTFNLVPSLIAQIESYLSDSWHEDELLLFSRRAEDLTAEEKHSILHSFFLCPEERLIRPYPRYAALLRDSRLRNPEDLLTRWSVQEWRDLQFWRQLAWIDPFIRHQDPVLEDLFRQGQNFDEAQKEVLLERCKHWLGESLGIYRRMQDAGLIEVSVSPFYHPILPLLADPASVLEAMPDCPLPDRHGRHPEDARAQLSSAIEFYEQRFGRPPRGVWPSEGSVSEETAALLGELGVGWFATDEAILGRSLGIPIRHGEGRIAAAELYQPYRSLEGAGPAVIFRDHRLSDLIGFQYSSWDPEEAAANLVEEILAIRDRWSGPQRPLISIILDGENCWEYYVQDGGPFLDSLHGRIQDHPAIRCLTVSEALAEREPTPLARLSAGSWINGDFYIWMGEEADRRAWTVLEETRQALVEVGERGDLPPERLREAWEELYVAEGSDWFWWFGESQQSGQDALFDELFRLHLLRVHELIGRTPPRALLAPIESRKGDGFPVADPQLPCPPTIDGSETHYYEWRAAARFDPVRSGGAMQQVSRTGVELVYFGVDKERFYLRVDPSRPKRSGKVDWRWELRIAAPTPLRFRFTPRGEGFRIERQAAGDGSPREWEEVPREEADAAEESVFEAALSWSVLETVGGETLSFFIGSPAGKNEVELIPPLSSLCVITPGTGRPGRHWFP
ncbi:MAG: hypothetical protein GHCLOJNM_03834 [bacterium]|nr:hypothetical protein [bacterium]